MSPNETPRNSRETAYSAIAIVAALVALIIAAIAYFAPNAQTPNENKPPIVAISASNYHSLALDGEGKVYAVGTSYFGQLGLGDNGWEADRKSFTLVDSLEGKKIVAIAAGSYYSLALSNDGIVYAAGNNRYGQLGLGDSGDENSRNVFTLVSSLEGRKIVAIAAGKYHSLTLDADGKVYATGRNNDGQLGLGDSDLRKTWTFVESLEDKKIVAIAAGEYHSLALDADGKLYATGSNGGGQLGLDDNASRNVWTSVESLNDKKITAIEAGAYYSLALDADGKLYATGSNGGGQLGLDDNASRNVWTSVESLNDKKIVAISAGDSHSLALDSDGKLYATGFNRDGRLGLGDRDHRKTWTLVESLSDKKVVAIAAGSGYSMASDKSGILYATGDSQDGRFGFEDKTNHKVFTFLAPLKGKSIVAISAGDSHSLALDADSKLYATGKNDSGELGLGDDADRNVWTPAESLKSKKIVAIAAGGFHSQALDNGGAVYATGYNRYGQLGLGDTQKRKTFAFVSSLKGRKIVAIAARLNHSLALDGGGGIYATGRNNDGQLGLGDKNDRKSFTLVDSLNDKNITAIAAGDEHSLALDSDGKLYATGNNEFGQLGLGDTRDRNIWTPVSSLSDKKIVAIAAGRLHSFALDSDGKLYAAGSNYFGQLGLGDTSNCSVFVSVSSLERKKIVAVAAGDDHSLALDDEGKTYATGWNRDGQLGLGDKNNRKSFTLVDSLRDKNITAIAADDDDSLALGGEVYGAGRNINGQLGLDDKDIRDVFTPVDFPNAKDDRR